MEISKPDQISLLPRTLEWGPTCVLAVTGLAGFRLTDPAAGFVSETDLWDGLARGLGEDQALDAGYPKSVAEVLLIGSCHAPAGEPVSAMKARLQFGSVDKTLYVLGDRFWEPGLVGVKASAPQPFRRMPLSWDQAFGGSGFELNPLGKGSAPILTPEKTKLHPLPNVENPATLVVSFKDRPDPAGFGPLDPAWPQRRPKAGSFGSNWLRDEWPGFPAEQDASIFNTAPRDQRLADWPRFDEAFRLEGVHPNRPVIESQLPNLALRVYLTRKAQRRESAQELGLRIDTVWFLPDQDLVVLAFRGQTPVVDEACSDIVQAYAVVEDLGGYRPAAAPENTAPAQTSASVRVVPDKPPVQPVTPAVEASSEPSPEILALEARIMEAENVLRTELAKIGVDYDQIVPLPLSPGIPSFPQFSLPEMSMEEAEAALTRVLQEAGIDPVRMATPQLPDFTNFSFDSGALMASLSAEGLLTPEMKQDILALEGDLEKIRAELKALPLPEADEEKPTEPLPPPALNRETVEAYFTAGRRDFVGLDLSGLDLSEMDLGGILLTGSNLAGAKLTGARLVEADLTGADLTGAEAAGADFTGAVLDRVAASELNLAAAKLIGAGLTGADLTRALLSTADLSAAKAKNIVLTGANLDGATLVRSDLSGADLDRSSLTGADFSESRAPDLSLNGAAGEGVGFRKAMLHRLRLDKTSKLTAADFSGADLRGSYGGGADLSQAVFAGARLNETTFQNCLLGGANFHRAQARNTRFLGCDLTETRMTAFDLLHGSLAGSKCERTMFNGSNLFEVDTLKTTFIDARFEQANLKRTRIASGRPKA